VQHVDRTGVEGLRAGVLDSGDDDDPDARVECVQVATDREAVDERHVEIEGRRVGNPAPADERDRLTAVGSSPHVVPVSREPGRVELAKGGLVVRDEDPAHVGIVAAPGKNGLSWVLSVNQADEPPSG
jgi:hypothetical protein